MRGARRSLLGRRKSTINRDLPADGLSAQQALQSSELGRNYDHDFRAAITTLKPVRLILAHPDRAHAGTAAQDFAAAAWKVLNFARWGGRAGEQ
jgi:hypothetical protein